MSVFKQQKTFMEACDQSVGTFNPEQFQMHLKLIDEEYTELRDSVKANDPIEVFDALLDLIVVCIGGIHSLPTDADSGWEEVIQTNLAKIDPTTGKVKKREDGKVLKPSGWVAPDLSKHIDSDKVDFSDIELP
jgi:predicted HAD superfamily Cof-like phosphohydrolase